ncbi:MAG: GTPase domain-containing protein [Deltaproteobacteria bacterium]|nr:GTPase domain-containing protein [Deltaproteobacteria bacterium]
MSDRAKEVALDQLVRVLDRVPLVSSVKNDLSGLRSLLYRRRPPRIAALGRANSGRSTLLRALIERRPARDPLQADHGQWVHLEHEGAKVHWLEIDVDDSQWKTALENETPDLVLLTFEPNDAQDMGRTIERAKSLLPDVPEGSAPLRVFPLLTHSDLIGRGEPDIEAARNELEAKLRDSGLDADPARAVSSISGDGLRGLSEAMILALPEEARGARKKGAFESATRSFKPVRRFRLPSASHRFRSPTWHCSGPCKP